MSKFIYSNLNIRLNELHILLIQIKLILENIIKYKFFFNLIKLKNVIIFFKPNIPEEI
jgi:hypothetical protein